MSSSKSPSEEKSDPTQEGRMSTSPSEKMDTGSSPKRRETSDSSPITPDDSTGSGAVSPPKKKRKRCKKRRSKSSKRSSSSRGSSMDSVRDRSNSSRSGNGSQGNRDQNEDLKEGKDESKDLKRRSRSRSRSRKSDEKKFRNRSKEKDGTREQKTDTVPWSTKDRFGMKNFYSSGNSENSSRRSSRDLETVKGDIPSSYRRPSHSSETTHRTSDQQTGWRNSTNKHHFRTHCRPKDTYKDSALWKGGRGVRKRHRSRSPKSTRGTYWRSSQEQEERNIFKARQFRSPARRHEDLESHWGFCQQTAKDTMSPEFKSWEILSDNHDGWNTSPEDDKDVNRRGRTWNTKGYNDRQQPWFLNKKPKASSSRAYDHQGQKGHQESWMAFREGNRDSRHFRGGGPSQGCSQWPEPQQIDKRNTGKFAWNYDPTSYRDRDYRPNDYRLQYDHRQRERDRECVNRNIPPERSGYGGSSSNWKTYNRAGREQVGGQRYRDRNRDLKEKNLYNNQPSRDQQDYYNRD